LKQAFFAPHRQDTLHGRNPDMQSPRCNSQSHSPTTSHKKRAPALAKYFFVKETGGRNAHLVEFAFMYLLFITRNMFRAYQDRCGIAKPIKCSTK